MRPARALSIVVAVLMLLAAARPAHADATVFVGANTTPANRSLRGFSAGISLLVVGFEFEYAVTSEDQPSLSPSLKTGMGNVLLQPPFEIFGFLPYVTGGVGLYKEELGAISNTGVGLNTGGGVKVSLFGPIRLRVDYRVIRLENDALASPAHRIYAGLNLAF